MKKSLTLLFVFLLFFSATGLAQQSNIQLEISPNPLQVKVDESTQIKVKAFDENGKEIKGGMASFINLRSEGAVPTSGIEVDSTGLVTGRVPGDYRIVVAWAELDNNLFKTEFLSAKVKYGKIGSVELKNFPEKIYAGSVIPLNLAMKDDQGFAMPESQLGFVTSNKEVAEVDELLNFYAKTPGKTTLGLFPATMQQSPITGLLYIVNSTCTEKWPPVPSL